MLIACNHRNLNDTGSKINKLRQTVCHKGRDRGLPWEMTGRKPNPVGKLKRIIPVSPMMETTF